MRAQRNQTATPSSHLQAVMVNVRARGLAFAIATRTQRERSAHLRRQLEALRVRRAS